MKKIFALVITAAMLLAMAAIPASASQSGAPLFYLEGPSTAKAGSTINVTLLVKGEYMAHTLNLRVFFDNTSYRLVGKTFGDAYREAISDGGWGICELNMEHNAVSLGIMMISSPMSVQGELVKFDFEVLGTASPETEFQIIVEGFGYMPIGQSTATELAYNVSGLKVKVTGGTGSGTTPNPIVTPKPGGAIVTPAPTVPGANPGKTDNPNPPDGSDAPRDTRAPDSTTDPNHTPPAPTEAVQPTEPSGDATDDPNASAEPAVSGDPDASAEPAGSEEPGHEEPKKSSNTGLIVGLCAVAAAGIAALCTVLAKRSGKKKGN